MGMGWHRVGTPLTVLAALTLIATYSRRRMAVSLAQAVGLFACYWLALVHLARPSGQVAWWGLLPYWPHPENGPASWTIPYTVFIYCGIIIGLIQVWTGTRAWPATRREAATLWVPLFITLLAVDTGRRLVTGPQELLVALPSAALTAILPVAVAMASHASAAIQARVGTIRLTK